MAAFDLVSNISDVRFKPRLLRSLLKERVPDIKHPFHNLSELSHVVSLIKTHSLLSESSPRPINQKLIDDWKSAVDDWVDRLLALLSCNLVKGRYFSLAHNLSLHRFLQPLPDKCWAGICLLGVTCQECSSDRFLSSYSVWLNKLLSHIQSPADSHLVKVACCASVSDLFSRLGGFPNIRKDGNSHAGKLIQPVLKLLNDDNTEAVWEGAIQLLCTILKVFPSSVNRYYDLTETAIASKIMSGKCSGNMLEKFAHCLALLPRSRGDEDSWSLIMRKILFMVNDYLNEAFQGLEEEEPGKEAIRLLVSPGQDPPPPLGSQTLSGESLNPTVKRSERLLISSVSSLIHCSSIMITSSYPAKVTVPIRSLLTLIERVLMVDGSLAPSRYSSFVTSMQQQSICSELPVLHSSCLELLITIIKGFRSQLLPQAAYIVRFVNVYFKRCTFPELRIKVYSITKILLMSMGVGIAIYLAQEVISNILVDLNPAGQENGGTSSGAFLKASEALPQPSNRKRKHGNSASSADQHDTVLEHEAPEKCFTCPISVQIAALEVLEILLTVGGGLGSASWRPNIDLLLITIATNSFEEEWANTEKNNSIHNESPSTWTAFRLAALRALLASLLSPARVRPPYLARGLELFRRGRQESGAKLAEFCAHALLVLEVLIHPRAPAIMDFASAENHLYGEVDQKYSEYTYSGGKTNSNPFSSGNGIPDSDDDDDLNKWVGNGDDIEAPVTDQQEIPETVKASVDGSYGSKNAETSEQRPPVVRNTGDEIMVESDQSRVPDSAKSITTPANAILGGSKTGGLHYTGSGKGALVAGGNVTKVINPYNAIIDLQKSKGPEVELDDDPFPEIVDEDPDSDSD